MILSYNVLFISQCVNKERRDMGITDTGAAKKDVKSQHCFSVVSSGSYIHCLWAHLLLEAQVARNCRLKQFWLKQVLLFLFHSHSIFNHRMLWEGLVKWQICSSFPPPIPCILLFYKLFLPLWLISCRYAPTLYRLWPGILWCQSSVSHLGLLRNLKAYLEWPPCEAPIWTNTNELPDPD